MAAAAFTRTDKPFPAALRELLIEHDYVKGTGDPNWHSFAGELDGVHYETLRKVLARERNVTPHLMEECARVLRIKPDYFAEYRLHEARRLYDVGEVGFDAAMANLEKLGGSAGRPAAAARRRRS